MLDTWSDPSWRATAEAWIVARLDDLGLRVTGPIGQPHVRPWATVLRVPTDHGVVFFKANEPALRHETTVTALIAERRPDLVPPPLAIEPERGWLLTADAGPRLREVIEAERDLDRWHDVLRLYAGLQVSVLGDAESFVAAGAPDLRLHRLPSLFAELLDVIASSSDVVAAARPGEIERLRASTPVVDAMCEELGAFGIPETIEHDDLNDGQIFVKDGTYAILDWGDACVTHPFFSLSVPLEGVIAWGLDDVADSVPTAPFRDAYLAPFADRLPGIDLVAASTIAVRLGWICRAINGHRAAGTSAESTLTRLRMFLDGQP